MAAPVVLSTGTVKAVAVRSDDSDDAIALLSCGNGERKPDELARRCAK